VLCRSPTSAQEQMANTTPEQMDKAPSFATPGLPEDEHPPSPGASCRIH
jgi:hypothetical protein